MSNLERMINISIVIFCVVLVVSAKINSNEGVNLKEVKSISQFIAYNPDVNLILMDAYTNDDASRTYSLGRRQTGWIFLKLINLQSNDIFCFVFIRRCSCGKW